MTTRTVQLSRLALSAAAGISIFITAGAALAADFLPPGARYAPPPGAYPGAVVVPSPYVAPGPVPYAAAPVIVNPVYVNPLTGRRCTYEPSGWHWCWTP
jgi:type II secretory pathway pseudopilin PulG